MKLNLQFHHVASIVSIGVLVAIGAHGTEDDAGIPPLACRADPIETAKPNGGADAKATADALAATDPAAGPRYCIDEPRWGFASL